MGTITYQDSDTPSLIKEKVKTSMFAHKPLKKAYLEFTHLDRKMTICVITHHIEICGNIVQSLLSVGLAILNPNDDNYSLQLGREISLGKAMKNNIFRGIFPGVYSRDYGILKSVAYYWQARVIKNLTFEDGKWTYHKL